MFIIFCHFTIKYNDNEDGNLRYVTNLMSRGPVFNTLAYQRPYKLWSEARALWDNPRDEIR